MENGKLKMNNYQFSTFNSQLSIINSPFSIFHSQFSIKKMFQFIANSADSAGAAIAAGCTWIHCTRPEALDSVIGPCRDADVILTLQGNPERVMDSRIHGTVLGPTDRPAAEVREYLGPHATIGCRVTTLFELLNLAPLDIDFFVLSAPLNEFGKIVAMARQKGVEQRISALGDDPAYLSAGADALMTANKSVL